MSLVLATTNILTANSASKHDDTDLHSVYNDALKIRTLQRLVSDTIRTTAVPVAGAVVHPSQQTTISSTDESMMVVDIRQLRDIEQCLNTLKQTAYQRLMNSVLQSTCNHTNEIAMIGRRRSTRRRSRYS